MSRTPLAALPLALLLTSMLALAVPCAAAVLTPPDSLVAWWRAEGDGSDQLGLNSVTLSSGAGYAEFGALGQGFNLPLSTGYCTTGSNPDLRPRNLTVECWFKLDALGNTWHTLVSKTLNSTWESFGLFWRPNYFSAFTCDLAGYSPTLQCNFTPTVGRWYHVAFTFDDDSDTQRIYVDGQLCTEGTSTKTIAYDTHPVMLGAEQDGAGINYYLGGAIDEVRLYKRALTAEEIATLYSGYLDVPRPAFPGVSLAPVTPTPARGAARVRFTLPGAAAVTLDVLDLQGRRVARLLGGETRPAGSHEVPVVTAGWRPGCYLVRLECEERTLVRRMLVLR